MNAIPGMSCVAPQERVLRDAARSNCRPGKTDADFVLGLLRAKGVLRVYGSGFGTAPKTASSASCSSPRPTSSSAIYDDVADFTAEFRSA